MDNILIGTSGYYYDDWRGRFYPAKMKKGDLLSYYAEHFSTVELNFSFYRIPDKKAIRSMIVRSKGKLTFVLKAFRGLTHDISDESLKDVLEAYKDGISPIFNEGLLGGVLLQFPQSFHYVKENRVYLKKLIDGFGDINVFVEFRHRSWIRESVFNTLNELNAGFVCVDEPRISSLLPPVVKRTGRDGYIRFHGRNKENWYGTDSSKRYDYLYSEDELREWIPGIMTIKKDASSIFIFFNNHPRAQAITNARMLINLLSALHLSA